MKNKLGAQCQMGTGTLLDYCRVVKPKAAMGIMVQERSFYEELRRLDVKTIYRHFPNFHWTNPETHAREAVSALKRETAGFRDLLTWVLGNNEEVHAHMTQTHSIADRFMAAFVHEVHTQLGLHAIVLNPGTGNYRADILSFPLTLEALDGCPRCRLGWHEYDWPTMHRIYSDGLEQGNDGCWHTLRWKVASQAIKDAGFHNVKFAITECGIDGGVIPGQDNLGWRKTHHDWSEAVQNYRRSLAWYMDALERDDDVGFALLYGVGMNDDWRDKGFEVPRELWDFIANYRIYPEVKR